MSELKKFGMAIQTIARLLMKDDIFTARCVTKFAYDGTDTDATNVIDIINDLLKGNKNDS